jgi:RNA polymerase sigma-70 factor, ECF subfamily
MGEPEKQGFQLDEELVRESIAGNQGAQRAFFQRFKKLFYNLAYKSLGPMFDLDEVVHEIFIQVFRALPSFKGKAALDTWAYRIAMNVCLSRLRTKMKKRQLNLVHGLEGVEDRVPHPGGGPHDDLLQKELEGKIFDALTRIDARKHMIIVMHDMEGKSIEQIATLMRKPQGTIKSRLFHGRKELKKYLQKYIRS